MADDPYIAGLRAAEAACWARSHRHAAERRQCKHDPALEKDCTVEALEATECAVEIKRLIAARVGEVSGANSA